MNRHAGRCALLLVLLLAGCAQKFPAAAPTQPEIERAPDARDFLLLDLDAPVARRLADWHPPSLSATFSRTLAPSLQLRAGDAVTVTIFESGANALFAPSEPPAATTGPGTPLLGPLGTGAGTTAGHTTTLPPQIIDTDGRIAVPYAGRVRVLGLTPQQAGERITAALAGRAVQPQVLVTLISTEQDVVVVGGDVGHPGALPVTLRGVTILDALAEAGGAKYEAHEMDVQLIRHGRAATVRLQTILDDAAENIGTEAGDRLYLLHNPPSFVALGAAQKAGRYPFPTARVSLAEAVAQAGGASETAGDVGALYLFRFEPPALAEQLVGAGDPRAATLARLRGQPRIPVAYRVNLRDPAAYFTIQTVPMRDKDVVLVTDAQANALQKLLVIVRALTGIVYDVKPVGHGGY
jgi:polysaccharide export outer membrane protein